MKFKFITSILLPAALLLVLPLGAGDPPALRQDYQKNYSKNFRVDGSGDVRLSNRYGEITVETWDRDEVKIDVRVKVSADDQDDADRLFDRIEVSFSGGANSASAITSVGTAAKKKGGIISTLLGDMEWPWSSSGGSSSNSNDFRVYYRVKMPAAASLETEAKYCDVSLPDLSGNNNLSVGYGNLVAGDLTGRNQVSVSYGTARINQLGDNSTFRVRYCDGNEIRKATSLRYDGRYSETEIGTVDRLSVDAGYEEIKIESAREVRVDGNYNDIVVNHAERIYLDGNYSDVKIGELIRELEVDASYGDLEIDHVRTGFESIYIRTNYIDVELDVDSDAGFTFDLSTRYGDIEFDTSRATRRNSDKSGSSSSLTGSIPGKGRSKIDISSSYGDITID